MPKALMLIGLIGLGLAGCGPSREAYFKRHAINADSRFEVAGVLDVNGDARLDIWSGGWWYEAPDWKKHFVREVEPRGEYYEDFANLPYDVDGDGWMDVITVAYGSKKLSWIRNPGRGDVPFEEIVIDTPASMESAILADVNGDGRLDILPHLNMVGATYWYEWTADATAPYGMRWMRHVIEESGKYVHGIGVGDLNGDGRPDILRADGWWEQPAEREAAWIFHQEWQAAGPASRSQSKEYTDVVGRASIPILAHDVDGDGDMDIIYGMGHDFGLYWLEQERDATGRRTWSKHEIDVTWSQVHVVLLGDLNLDGRLELVAGKRYRAHDGKDPGDNEPPRIYYYTWNPARRQWQRHTIDDTGQAGLGISTQLADIDGDGDLDLVAPGKTGLYLFENLRR